ncbi:MAG: DUF5703 domain-containing protein, partial [Planctomycetota bacterium]|jgi:hypothetical protein
VRITPAPLAKGAKFKQRLRLEDATLHVRFGEGAAAIKARVWVDANRPVIHVEVDALAAVEAVASIELWRTKRETLPSVECSDVFSKSPRREKTVVEPDTVLEGLTGRIGWYHRNVKSVGPAFTARIQGVADFPRADPLLHNTFGAVVRIEGQGGERIDDLHLRSPAAMRHRIAVHVLTKHPASVGEWLGAMDSTVAEAEGVSFSRRRAAHERWWREFWDRSWIHVTQGAAGTGESPVPANSHPIRIGVDQGGGNRFAGEIGRVSVFENALSGADVKRLAALGREERLGERADVLYSEVGGAPPTVEGSAAAEFRKGMTLEVWAKAERLGANGARIVDKITPGVDDGVLLDTWPGNSLRLIAGGITLRKKDCLPAGKWAHVAAVIGPGQGSARLYLNGELLAENGGVGGGDAFIVSRAYALQRYVNACAGRGRYPIKFNGSIFTVPHAGKPGDADYRRWGPGYWWQNTRLPYISTCASGDYDLMEPLFRMYARDLMPLFKHRTRVHTGHAGAYIAECIYFWGDMFSQTYGWQPCSERTDKLQTSRWHKWEWVSGPELVFMMLDRYEHTLDEEFLKGTLLPAAREVLTFFDLHYKNDAAGKMVMHPSMACETWWDCTNPMPELAGLHAVTDRLMALPDRLTSAEERAFWKRLKGRLPDLPTREVNGVRMLAPAERFAMKRNSENPELYAVFPFRLVAVGRPGLELGVEALRHRWNRGNSGWRQDDIFMAYLGLADDARKNLVGRARKKHSGSRFPAFWGPNYDWIPDQDHGGILLKALQAMVLQTDGRRVHLLPAWPEGWDVDFKLHAPYRTVVRGKVKNGEVVRLEVTPASRRGDVKRRDRAAGP